MAGPALAGVLSKAMAAPVALIGDALSHLASLASLLALRIRWTEDANTAEGGKNEGESVGYFASIGRGFAVLRDLPVRTLGLGGAAFIAFGGVCESFKPVFALRVLGMSLVVLCCAMTFGLSGGVIAVAGLRVLVAVAGRCGGSAPGRARARHPARVAAEDPPTPVMRAAASVVGTA
ncbi:hypothetical protein [Streptomyces sp. LS1784]|uniref:hypothetical protein n=1 Tax=Streptomyces sp. LS1784 TaxID=2851533 RepID=UPI001CCC502C|nr:hypothetical protein [Streptomyces sp. LS1784]